MRTLFSLFLAATMFAGCAVDDATSETQQGIESSNRIALNRIALNRIALNRIALNSITTQNLINEDPELLDYLLSCAFPADVTLVATDDAGVEHEFHGGIGLAPMWDTRRLTNKEQRWMSACMLARVNNAGASIFISLRGPNTALTVTAEESNEFRLEEGAFYGDIFAEQQRFYACRGAALYSGNYPDTFALRTCAKPTEAGDKTVCGMTYAGDCGAFAVERACEKQVDGNYGRCHSESSTNGRWHDEGVADRFEEAITVYVKQVP